MRRGLVALALSSIATAALPGHADAHENPPLLLRYSERLALPPAAELPALPTKPRARSKLRRSLSLSASLAAWSGTRRNDSADFVAVPRLGIEGSASLPLGFSAALLADAAREQATTSADSRSQATLREAWLG